VTASFFRAGSTAHDDFALDIDQDGAGWEFSALRVVVLAPGVPVHLDTDGDEVIVVPLEGSLVVSVEGVLHELTGRPSPFAGRTDALYLPRETRVSLASVAGARVALPAAAARRRLSVQYRAVGEVPLLIRGAGPWTRRVHDFCNPQGGFETDRLIAVEVLNPGGNWSGIPRHKHDVASEHESALEEMYYFEAADSPGGPGFGYLRTSSSEAGEIDVTEEVRTGDTILIPFGWHGPVTAPPGNDLYYLNVMAGPGEGRAWNITDHPEDAWVREAWNGLEPDPRASAATYR